MTFRQGSRAGWVWVGTHVSRNDGNPRMLVDVGGLDLDISQGDNEISARSR